MPNSVERSARNVLFEYVAQCPSQRIAARQLGISAQYLGDMLHFKRPVPERLLRKFGYRYETQLVKVND